MKTLKSLTNGLGLSVMTVFFFMVSLIAETGSSLKKIL